MIVELEIRELVVPQGLLPRVLTGTVEEKVEEYKEMLEQGVEFDPIVVWKRPDGQYWIVDGVHRTEAHKRAGRTTIKAKIVELKDELEYRIEAIKANLKHGLPLRKEEKVILAQTLYKLGVPVAELKKLFGVAERTIYYWLESIKHQEKLELKKKALELKEQGMSLREIADRLGVPKSTVEDWVNESVRFLQKLQFSDSIDDHPKAKVLWDELKDQREKEKRLEGYVLEKAKEILSDIDYQFSTWKSLRFELSRRGVEISGYEELVDEILHKHADELLEVYRRIPEATEDSISMEELIKIKEEVQGEKDRWAREYKAREAIRRVLREKGLRIINSVVERAVKKIEELVRQEEWEKLEQIAKEIEETTPEEIWEDLREDYEKFGKKAQEQKRTKEKEKKETTPLPSIEDYYRNELEGLLLKMGLALGWSRAFEIAEEILKKVREYSKTMDRGW
jgi:transposase